MKKEIMIATAISKSFLDLLSVMVEINKSCGAYTFVIKEKGKCVDLKVEEPGYKANDDELAFDIKVDSDLFEGDAEEAVFIETLTALAKNLSELILNDKSFVKGGKDYE